MPPLTETYGEFVRRRHREQLLARRAAARAAVVLDNSCEFVERPLMSGFDRLLTEIQRYLEFVEVARS